MSFNFPLILLILTIASGLIWLIASLFWIKHRKPTSGKIKHPLLVDYARYFFPILLVVLIIRSFIVQPFRVPTGSLEPTVLPGDFILVNQFAYGLHFPAFNWEILPLGKPKRGDIAVFHWPVNAHKDFVKRVIGLPGDNISYVNKILYINGKKIPQKLIGYAVDSNNPSGPAWTVKVMQENLLGIKYNIYRCANESNHCPLTTVQNFHDVIVPAGEYFMMGDNRDNSDDSRYWGFVPEKDLVGKAFLVWMSWDSAKHRIRWHRIGKRL